MKSAKKYSIILIASVFCCIFSSCNNELPEKYLVKPTAYSEEKVKMPDYAMATIGTFTAKDVSRTAEGDSLHLSVSDDGKKWYALNNNEPIFLPNIGTGHIRDVSIFRLNDGSFVLLGADYTKDGSYSDLGHLHDTNYGDNPSGSIYVAFSKDLVSWTNEHLLTVTEALAKDGKPRHAWSPRAVYNRYELCYDIYWVGNDENDVNQVFVSQTSDFITLKDKVERKLFAPGYSVTGAYAFNDGKTQYLVFRDDTNDLGSGLGHELQMAVLKTGWRTGDYKLISDRYTYLSKKEDGTRSYSALPCVYKLADGSWIMIASSTTSDEYNFFKATDPSAYANWTGCSADMQVYSNNSDYKTYGCSVIKITEAEYGNLITVLH